jgi:NAD-dependent dihydropyrimidine dehydrogenase PreA subunit
MTKKLTVIISPARTADAVQESLQRELIGVLTHKPSLDLVVLPPLYDLAAEGATVRRLQSIPGHLIVLSSLHPRAAYWVLCAYGVHGRMGCASFGAGAKSVPAGPSTQASAGHRMIWCLDLRSYQDAESLLTDVYRIVEESVGAPPTEPAGEPPPGGPLLVEPLLPPPRWYPVIDFDRCVNCLECLNFCLFGVFGLDEAGHILVEQPDACRDGCPACSRICPAGAILFPHYNDAAIAGDPSAPVAAAATFGPAVPRADADAQKQQAAAERERAMTEGAARTPGTAAEKDTLERLVDELDGSEL